MVLRAMPALLERLPGTRLLVVGRGAGEAGPRGSRCGAVPGTVLFPGARAWADIPAYYRAADVFVTASATETPGPDRRGSHGRRGPRGRAPRSELLSMIDDGVDGLLFSDDGELTEVLFRALSDKRLALALASAAREKSKEYSAQGFGERVEEVYEEAVGLRARHGSAGANSAGDSRARSRVPDPSHSSALSPARGMAEVGEEREARSLAVPAAEVVVGALVLGVGEYLPRRPEFYHLAQQQYSPSRPICGRLAACCA